GVEDDTAVVLEDVALTVPYLKVGQTVPLSKDERIYLGRPPAEETAPVAATAAASTPTVSIDWAATVRTAKPVLLYSNLAEQPIPVALDLDADAQGLTGDIRIEKFSARLFRQSAQIDHVFLSPVEGEPDVGLDGLILYPTPDAVIRILLLGTT